MTAQGVVRGSLVVLDQGVRLPEGTRVEVRALLPQETRVPSQEEREAALKDLISLNLPVADWEQMEKEIIEGAYGRCPP